MHRPQNWADVVYCSGPCEDWSGSVLDQLWVGPHLLKLVTLQDKNDKSPTEKSSLLEHKSSFGWEMFSRRDFYIQIVCQQ